MSQEYSNMCLTLDICVVLLRLECLNTLLDASEGTRPILRVKLGLVIILLLHSF